MVFAHYSLLLCLFVFSEQGYIGIPGSMGKEKVLLYNYYCDVALYFAKYVRIFCVRLWMNDYFVECKTIWWYCT